MPTPHPPSTDFTGWREKDDRTIREVRRLMREDELDALLPWKAAHVAYLMNFFDSVHAVIPWEEMLCFLVIPLERDAFMAGNHASGAGWPEFGVHPWWLKTENRSGEWWGSDENIAVLADQFRKRGLSHARVGYERKWVPVSLMDKLRAALPGVTWKPADRIVPQVRLVKSSRELELMRKAVLGGFAAMDAYMNVLRAGGSLVDAQLARAKKALDEGVDWVGGAARMAWTGGTYETLRWWDAPARERYLKTWIARNWQSLPDGAPICVTHFETQCDGYFSDIAWHEYLHASRGPDELIEWAALNEPGTFTRRELQADYDVMRVVQREAINRIRPGMTQTQARAAVEDYLKHNADYQRHGTGYFVHSLGIEVHEEPILATANPRAMPYDEVMYFEPGIVCSSEWFSKHWTIEDPFVMGENGVWEPLTELRGIDAPQA